MSSMTFLGEIMSSRFSKPKSTLSTPWDFLLSIRVKSIFKKSLLWFSGISVSIFSGMFSGFLRVYRTDWVLASKKE